MSLAESVRAGLRANADPERAPRMRAYMKSEMPFLGVPLPRVRAVTTAARRECPPAGVADLETTVRELWDAARYREERYAAQQLLRGAPARGELALLPLYEHIAVTGAWWDHVDEAAHGIGYLHDAHPAETRAAALRWAVGDDVWLRRLAIIGQLGRRDRVDTDLLVRVIEPSLAEREFFLRKAIGWALRQHAKTDPDWVRGYVAEHRARLSPLSAREALKNL